MKAALGRSRRKSIKRYPTAFLYRSTWFDSGTPRVSHRYSKSVIIRRKFVAWGWFFHCHEHFQNTVSIISFLFPHKNKGRNYDKVMGSDETKISSKCSFDAVSIATELCLKEVNLCSQIADCLVNTQCLVAHLVERLVVAHLAPGI